MDTDRVITQQMCEQLTQTIKKLKDQDARYAKAFTNKCLSQMTGIPFGSIGLYMANDSLPLHRYKVVDNYVKSVIELLSN